MTDRQKWLSDYICNFMAAFDASRMYWSNITHEWVIDQNCEYKFAKGQAEKAWKIYKKGAKL